MMTLSKNQKTSGIAFLSGMAAGYALSVFLPDNLKSETKQQLRKIKSALTDPNEREKIKDIFKEQTDETVTAFHMTKNRLARNLNEFQTQFDEISKDKYYDAIQDALDYVSEYQEIPTPQLNALKKYLRNDYDRVKAALQTET